MVSPPSAASRGAGGSPGGTKTVSASSPGTGVRTPVSTDEGRAVLQAGQRAAASGTSPAQFGHVRNWFRPPWAQGSIPR